MVAVEIGEMWVDSHCILEGAPTGLASVGGGAEEAVDCCSSRGLRGDPKESRVCLRAGNVVGVQVHWWQWQETGMLSLPESSL